VRQTTRENFGTIGLIHGYAHRAQHWDLLRPYLHALGFDTIAVDLPVYKPNATFGDYADAAAEAFRPIVENGGRIDIVAQSMGSHVTPGVYERLRQFGKRPVRSIVHLSGSLGEPSNKKQADQPTPFIGPIPRQLPRNTEEFVSSNLQLPDGTTVPDPAQIQELYYGDSDPETFAWAVGLIRRHLRPHDEPPLSAHRLPGVYQAYVLYDQDRIRNQKWVIAKPVGELGMRLIMRRGGDHSPAISRPAETALIIAGQIREAINSEETMRLPPPSSYLDPSLAIPE
jgi:hypothetical protein